MHLRHLCIALGTATAVGAAVAADDSYRVDVWASVLFGTDGTAQEVRVHEAEAQPAAFIDAARARLARARITPPQVNGAPATLRTGVRTQYEITRSKAGGGAARLVGLELLPLPIRQDYVGYPQDVAQTEGWDGEVTAVCEVTPAGVCGAIAVKAVPGIPESVKRFAKASMELWRFEPQAVGGVPIAGEYTLTLHLRTEGNAPEDFRQDKLLRILRNR